MLQSSQLTRTAVLAATVISLGATPAVAREADAPLHPGRTVTTVVPQVRQWTPPRVDAIGVRPANQPVAASPAPVATLPRQRPAAPTGC